VFLFSLDDFLAALYNDRGGSRGCAINSLKPRLFMVLKILYEPSDEGDYTVYVPALPGCISEGDTLEEARENIREAIELYLESTEEPVSEGALVEEIAV
jgi:predicted RNase H-like HicB family nuclease